MERPKLSTRFPFTGGEWVCSLKKEYPFIRHIPIAFVMSMSHVSGCAGMCRKGKSNEIPNEKRNGLCAFDFPVRSEKQSAITTGQLPVRR